MPVSFQNPFGIINQPNSPSTYTAPTNILSTDAQVNGHYLVDNMNFEYPYVSGKMAIPNTAGTWVIVTLHQPVALKIVRFEKVRLETPPDYPIADNSDSNLVLLWKNLQVSNPGVMTNMTARIFAVRGIYVYAMLSPAQDGNDLLLGLKACETRPQVPLSQPLPAVAQLTFPGSKAVKLF